MHSKFQAINTEYKQLNHDSTTDCIPSGIDKFWIEPEANTSFWFFIFVKLSSVIQLFPLSNYLMVLVYIGKFDKFYMHACTHAYMGVYVRPFRRQNKRIYLWDSWRPK